MKIKVDNSIGLSEEIVLKLKQSNITKFSDLFIINDFFVFCSKNKFSFELLNLIKKKFLKNKKSKVSSAQDYYNKILSSHFIITTSDSKLNKLIGGGFFSSQITLLQGNHKLTKYILGKINTHCHITILSSNDDDLPVKLATKETTKIRFIKVYNIQESLELLSQVAEEISSDIKEVDPEVFVFSCMQNLLLQFQGLSRFYWYYAKLIMHNIKKIANRNISTIVLNCDESPFAEDFFARISGLVDQTLVVKQNNENSTIICSNKKKTIHLNVHS